MNQELPVAMFKTEQTVYGPVYWPANTLAVDLCGIAQKLNLDETRMAYVRKRFKVIEPNGQPVIPFPSKRVSEVV